MDWGTCATKLIARNKNKNVLFKIDDYEHLFQNERNKCTGILNGIDYQVWNPEHDESIQTQYDSSSQEFGKLENKKQLCFQFGFDENLPLFIFIGRLVFEKSADLLAATIETAFEKFGKEFNFLVLGNGESKIESTLTSIHEKCFGYYHSKFEFNEQLSHQMYAGADFLFMPSRVEPCGLNQLYAMRYGTIPMVRNTGGLKDTVIDVEQENGYGITYENVSIDEMVLSIKRGLELYKNLPMVNFLRKKMMNVQ
jgi:starch synthase